MAAWRAEKLWARNNLTLDQKNQLAIKLHDIVQTDRDKSAGSIDLYEGVKNLISRAAGGTYQEKLASIARSPQATFDILKAAFRLAIPENVTSGDVNYIQMQGLDAWIAEKVKWMEGNANPAATASYIHNALVRAESSAAPHYDRLKMETAVTKDLGAALGTPVPGLWAGGANEFKTITPRGASLREYIRSDPARQGSAAVSAGERAGRMGMEFLEGIGRDTGAVRGVSGALNWIDDMLTPERDKPTYAPRLQRAP